MSDYPHQIVGRGCVWVKCLTKCNHYETVVRNYDNLLVIVTAEKREIMLPLDTIMDYLATCPRCGDEGVFHCRRCGYQIFYDPSKPYPPLTTKETA